MMLYSLTPFCEFCSRRLADYASDCRCGDAPGIKINKLIIRNTSMLSLDHVNGVHNSPICDECQTQ